MKMLSIELRAKVISENQKEKEKSCKVRTKAKQIKW